MNSVTSIGTVYGVLLNSQDEWDAWSAQKNEAPYKAAPLAPVLYIKTANTWSACGAPIALPAQAPEVEVGASLALLIGGDAHQVHANAALAHVAAYVLAKDLSLPHASYSRPPVKYKNLDGFLGIGPRFTTPALVGNPNRLPLEVRVDGRLQQTVSLARMRRAAAQLITDVSEFMTLHCGDVLLGALGWSDYTGQAEIVTPYFGASGTGQLNAVFPVLPVNGAAVPQAEASAARQYRAFPRI